MHCYQEEGSWSLSFAGAGFLGLYHVGVTSCFRERAPHLLQGARRIYGSSSGALNAMSIITGKTVGARGRRGRGARRDAGTTREGGRFRAPCLALGPAPFASSILPSKPYENPEDSGLWLSLFRKDRAELGSLLLRSKGGQSIWTQGWAQTFWDGAGRHLGRRSRLWDGYGQTLWEAEDPLPPPHQISAAPTSWTWSGTWRT